MRRPNPPGMAVVGVLLAVMAMFCPSSGGHAAVIRQHPDIGVLYYVENDTGMSDLDFAIDDVETNYSGFRLKVTDRNRGRYDAMVSALRRKVEKGRIDQFDAVAMYLGFFRDAHLATCDNGKNGHHGKYRKGCIDYGRRMTYAPDTVAVRLTEHTFLIRVPSFFPHIVSSEWVRSSVDRYLESGCENLIIDIRGNGGGSGRMYTPYLQLLSDHSGQTDGVMLYDTELNRKFMERIEPGIYHHGSPLSKEGPSNDYVFLYGNTMTVGGFHDRSAKPEKAAIIIDNRVASAAERFILNVRACSDRCVVYGKDNTRGCLDFSECRFARLSGTDQYYQVPMKVSGYVLKGISVDRNGIAPDVRVRWPLPRELSGNVDSWVMNVAAELEGNGLIVQP